MSTSYVDAPAEGVPPSEAVARLKVPFGDRSGRSLSYADLLVLLTTVVSLIAACAIASARKPFWNDEINVWMPASDPSLRHMFWAASHACSGGTSPLYLLLVRVWMAIAGKGVLAVRLLSCLGFCAGFVTLWVVLRRRLGFLPVAFALLTVWGTSDVIFRQLVEGRGYGFYVFAAALAIAVFDRIAVEERSSKLSLVATAIASGLLVTAHYFGILYSGLMLVSLFAWDRMNQRFRPRYYAAIAAGWLVLVPWLGAMGRDAALLHERSYFRTPIPQDLSDILTFGLSYLPVLAFVVIVGVAIAISPTRATEEPPVDPRRVRPLILLGVSWTLLPMLAFLAFQVLPRPAFLDRYMLPSVVSFAVVLAVAAEKVLAGARIPPQLSLNTSAERAMTLCWTAFIAILAVLPVMQARSSGYPPSVAPVLSKLAPPGVPVVVAWQWEFMQANFYAREEPPRYFFVLDRELAMSPNSAIDEPLFFNERTAWKNAGYWADRTLESEEFLCRFDRFAVLDAPGRLWYSRRVRHDPAFTVESETLVNGRYLAIVHRGGAALAGCPAK